LAASRGHAARRRASVAGIARGEDAGMSTVDAIGFSGTVLQWRTLDATARNAALQRPALERSGELRITVARIIAQVRADDNAALRALTRRFDGCELDAIEVDAGTLQAAERDLDPATREAIDAAYARITMFHRATAPQPVRVETAPGVVCERVSRPIERVGL